MNLFKKNKEVTKPKETNMSLEKEFVQAARGKSSAALVAALVKLEQAQIDLSSLDLDDPNDRMNLGNKALAAATWEGDPQNVQILLNRGVRHSEAVLWAASAGRADVVRVYRQNPDQTGIDFHFSKDAPLRAAFEREHYGAVLEILEKDKDKKYAWDYETLRKIEALRSQRLEVGDEKKAGVKQSEKEASLEVIGHRLNGIFAYFALETKAEEPTMQGAGNNKSSAESRLVL